MKHLVLALGVAATLAACSSAPDADKAKTSNAKEVSTSGSELAVNLDNSSVNWIGTKVTGQHTGNFPIQAGALMVKEGKLTGGNFTIDVANVTVTDLEGEWKAKLEGHLKSADFFAVDTFNTAKFEITAVSDLAATEEVKLEGANMKISGNLTLRGVTKNIEFPAAITMKDGMVMAMPDFNINRMDFNVAFPGREDDLIKNEVNIKLNIHAGNMAAHADHGHDGHDHHEGHDNSSH